MKIGIGVTTFNREHHIELFKSQLEKFKPKNEYILYIAQDVPSIEEAKNRCLFDLFEKNKCDVVFLFDDDCFPIKAKWDEYFINSQNDYLMYLSDGHQKVNSVGEVSYYKDCAGCFIYLTRSVFDKIGYFNSEFKELIMEHVGYSARANRALKRQLYECLNKTSEYLYSFDFQGSRPYGIAHESSFKKDTNSNFSFILTRSQEVLLRELSNDKIYYDYKSDKLERVIVATPPEAPLSAGETLVKEIDEPKLSDGSDEKISETTFAGIEEAKVAEAAREERVQEEVPQEIIPEGTQIYLITNFYVDSNAERQSELEYCVERNADAFDKIILLVEDEQKKYAADFVQKINYRKNIHIRVQHGRPTFNDYFRVADEYSGQINCIANTDIFYYREDIDKLKALDWENKLALCLSRWEINSIEGGALHVTQLVREDTSDSWIYTGKKPFEEANIQMGVAGVDNLIATRFNQKGYRVFNPSNEIKSYHYHLTNIRHYTDRLGNVEKRYEVSADYKRTPPCNISEIK